MVALLPPNLRRLADRHGFGRTMGMSMGMSV